MVQNVISEMTSQTTCIYNRVVHLKSLAACKHVKFSLCINLRKMRDVSFTENKLVIWFQLSPARLGVFVGSYLSAGGSESRLQLSLSCLRAPLDVVLHFTVLSLCHNLIYGGLKTNLVWYFQVLKLLLWFSFRQMFQGKLILYGSK